MNKYPNLFSPIRLGNVQLKNRLVSPPMSLNELTPEGYLRPEDIAYFELRAKGGAALVTVGESIVDSSTGKTHERQLPLDDDWAVPSLYKCAAAIRRHGAIASIELNHGGKFANVANASMKGNDLPTYGVMPEIMPDGTEVRQLDDEMIHAIARKYGEAAKRVQMAGFHMINIHAAHGISLVNHFMSPAFNQREDKWGGNFENRMRFVDLVLDSIRAEVGPAFPIEFRMNGAELAPGGYDVEEAIRIVRHIQNKVNLVNVSYGFHESMEGILTLQPDMFKKQGYFTELAAAIKKEADVPIAAVGAICDPEYMEELLGKNVCDIVEVGKGQMAEPFMAKKYRSGKEDEAVRCCRCFECITHSGEKHKQTRCALNPMIGRELETQYIIPARISKKVLVAGAGPAGLQAAITAARRGHKVTVCEAGDAVGGWLRTEKHVVFKQNLYKYPHILEKQARSLGVQFIFNKKVTPDVVEEIAPDVLVAAIGSGIIVPPIPGIDGSNVRHATEMPEDLSILGDNVTVLGGGLVGAEMAINLALAGKKVTIVEMADGIARDANTMHKSAIHIQMKKLGIQVHTKVRGKEITEKGLVGICEDGCEKLFPADTIMYALGMRPKWDECNLLRDCADEFYQIGDCVLTGKVKDATSMGYQIGLDI